jgi:hypothetical protein
MTKHGMSRNDMNCDSSLKLNKSISNLDAGGRHDMMKKLSTDRVNMQATYKWVTASDPEFQLLYPASAIS